MNFFRLAILFILLLPNLSIGQTIRVSDAEGKPVNQAVIYLNSLDGDDRQILITEASGKAFATPVLKKVQIVITHLTFENHVDTIDLLDRDIQISLTGRKVGLDEVVVTSEYAPRAISESVHPVTVINKEQIQAQAAPTLEGLLSQQLAIRVSHDAVLGSGMTMNGLSGQNIKILVDGVPVTGRLDGNIDLGQINLSNVERIEVVNGPMAASYGTDAAGGVINMITRKSVDGTYQAGINMMYESVGQYNMDAFTGFTKGKSALLVSGGRYFFDGWSVSDTGRWQEWKPKEQYFGNIHYRYTFKKLVLSYQLNGFHEKLSNKGTPRMSPYFAYAFDEYYKTIRITNQLNGSLLINRDWNATGTVAYSYYQRTKNTYRKDLVTLDESLLNGVEEQDTTLMHTWTGRVVFNRAKANAKLNYQGGVDILVENADGTRFTENVEQTGDYAVFASAEYQVTWKLQIKPAVRAAYNTDFSAPVIPSLMLKYDFGKNIQARASYGKGFRAPGIKERYLYFVDINHNIHGNENLQPENSDNFYFSLNTNFTTGKTSHNTQFAAFYNDIDNLITLAQPDPASSFYTYINIGHFATHGGNITHSVTWKKLTLNIGAGVTGRYNIYADMGDFDEYSYSPDLMINSQYYFSKIKLTAAVFFKYNGKLPGYAVNNDGSVSQFTNDSYRFLDFTLRKELFGNQLAIGAGIKNILNITNVNAYVQGAAHSSSGGEQAVGTGRTWFLNLKYNIGK